MDLITKALTFLFGSGSKTYGKEGGPQYSQTEPNIIQRIKGILPDYSGTKETPIQQYTPTSISSPVQQYSPTPTTETKKMAQYTPFDDLIDKYFGEDATNAKLVLRHQDESGYFGGENKGFETGSQIDIPNPDGSIDRGLYRINSNTFADFMNRKAELLKQNDINSWDDMLNVEKNIRMAKLIYDEQGWDAWYAAPSYLRGGE